VSEKRPQWKINKDRYNTTYNREHSKTIGIRLYDADIKYYEYWQAIPNKTEWLKEKLDEYAKENGLE
jgi:hypothetical protein